MPETEHSQYNIAEMLTRIGNVESMLRFTVGASADVKQHVETAMNAREGAAQVYLLFADGPLTQPEIEEKTGYSQANVSKICRHLVRCGLVARDKAPAGRGYIWRWTDMEEVVHVSKIATRLLRRSKAATNGRGRGGPAAVRPG